MTSYAEITENNGCLLVSGNLDFSTVTKLWDASSVLLSQASSLKFDLSKVSFVNSAGLALLLEWQRYARKHNKPISFSNMPLQLSSIAAVAGIQKIIQQ